MDNEHLERLALFFDARSLDTDLLALQLNCLPTLFLTIRSLLVLRIYHMFSLGTNIGAYLKIHTKYGHISLHGRGLEKRGYDRWQIWLKLTAHCLADFCPTSTQILW